MFESNEIINRLPNHLKSLIIDQPYHEYTAQDHAVWRYVMRQNIQYLKDIAHASYLSGLQQTGVSIEHIPQMYGMNRILKEIGWAAVSVDGFIPPSAFMEFQAYNVLVIAADIRPIDQIQYTPAPDIIHEAAGHAPIIANYKYAEYLKLFGKYGAKAFSFPEDKLVYQAIRHISILKANPYSSKEDISRAETHLKKLEEKITEPSEISQLRNLHWWTVEYGLIGDLDHPQIYGAGLLSSIGESYNALKDSVKKIPYSLISKDVNFDITSMQPQLFVTPSFTHLTDVLESFVNTMALRTGGLNAVNKAIRSESIACCVYDTGLQISGKFTNVIEQNQLPVYIQASGPVSLSYDDKEIPGHGRLTHPEGFGSPVGKLSNIAERFELLTNDELAVKNIKIGYPCDFHFESGLHVKGILKEIYRKDCKILIMSFEECTVSFKDKILYRPEWGRYDMAIGSSIISAFNGPADPNNYGYSFPVPKEKTHKFEHSEENIQLFKIYETIRNIREQEVIADPAELKYHFTQLKNEFPKDWLLVVEIYELAVNTISNQDFIKEIECYLQFLQTQHPEFEKLIQDGVSLVQNKKVSSN